MVHPGNNGIEMQNTSITFEHLEAILEREQMVSEHLTI